jgi:membrane protein required for colicin V production
MNYIDIIILIFAIWCGIRGLMHGLIRELATITALILAVWAVCLFQDKVIIWLGNIPAVTIIARILIFVIVLCLVHLVGKIIEKLIHLVLPSFINYVTGLLFGLAKALLIMSLLISLVLFIDTKEIILTPQAKQNSIFYPHVEPIFPKCKSYFQK